MTTAIVVMNELRSAEGGGVGEAVTTDVSHFLLKSDSQANRTGPVLKVRSLICSAGPVRVDTMS